MVAHFRIGEALVPAVLLLYGIGGIAGNVIASRLVDLIGPDRLILTSLVTTAVLFLVIQFMPADPWTGIPLFFLWSVAGMLLYAPQQARLVALAPDAGNLVLALNASGLYLGMAGGALLSGLLWQASEARHLAFGSAVLMVVATVAFLHSQRRVREG
jgi:predicted MFS family arabinose efflux permease